MSQSRRCRIGIHSWFVDSSFFSSADCCRRCGRYRVHSDAEQLNAERKLWKEAGERKLSFAGSLAFVATNLTT